MSDNQQEDFLRQILKNQILILEDKPLILTLELI
jgi:hypothetical protein